MPRTALKSNGKARLTDAKSCSDNKQQTTK
nr:MAG TPA: hypothetical protein [Caudoviricetes sp.]